MVVCYYKTEYDTYTDLSRTAQLFGWDLDSL